MPLCRVTLIRPHGPTGGDAPTPGPARETRHPWGVEATWTGPLADPASYRAGLRARAAAVGWDAAVLTGPLAERPARLLVMDVDSTLITAEVIDLLADAAGSGQRVAEITERAMHGELDFASSLRERVATLAGLGAGVLAEVAHTISFSPGAQDLVAAARASGAKVGVVSGGFIEVVRPLAEAAGIDYATANRLEVADGRLTGRTVGEVIDRAAKLRHTRRYAGLAAADMAEVVAVGDGANDLDMLAAAGLGVAYCAKPLAAAQADATVSFPRLDAVAAYAGFLVPHHG
ncbi:MAG: phosphoserine phosphatase SerB [Propionibacteriaceae bacterium]|nr:phosphoserine phosphatase SerB [Propionibacteriaceae bacterium]